jgi:AcrR family transcriptional regulator
MPYRLTERGERRREAMRSNIALAAAALFAQNGYHATTLREVVEAANTSIGNLYFYFANKEALLAEVVELASAEVGAAVDRAIEGVPPGPELLAIAVYEAVQRSLTDPAAWRFIKILEEAPEARTLALAHFIERTLRVFEAHPELCDGRPELAAHAWQGAIFHVLEAMATGTLGASPQDAGRFLVSWNLRALGLPHETVEAAMERLHRHIQERQSPNKGQRTNRKRKRDYATR